jgi:hypothetical protein
MSQSVVIYPKPDADPEKDRIVFEGAGHRVVLVAVPDEEKAASVVAGLVGEGAGLIELFGGFGADAAARVHVAAGGAPVGSVVFGIESMDAAAAFRA